LARAVLRFPALIVLAAGLLALAVALIAAGTGLTGTGLSGPPPAGCAPPVGAAVVSGVPLDATQLANARIIYAVGAGLGLPEPAEVIAIATAMQESSLRNLPYGSADSLGLFQQRPSQGWGPVTQIMDPVTAARAFYDQLVQVPGWQGLPVTVAAQAVQRSSFPAAYARWQPVAARLAASFAGTTVSCGPQG
jgi:hypothetical protein